MSKAFTSEETDVTDVVAPRASLPAGTPNYVTPRGLSLLREERGGLASARARAEASGDTALATKLGARLRDLDERLASAELVEPSSQADARVRFGATVTVGSEGGPPRRYRIVGVDEADPARGDVAFISPIARALLGREVGDVVTVTTPRGSEELEILALE
jgi:transcription elongation factor GreB